MKDYSQTQNQRPQGSLWKTVKAVFTRWADRERELASLRNVVGMMSEARQSDSREYHEMVDLNRDARADANRYRALRAQCECIDYGDIKDAYLRITGYGNTRTDDLVDSVVDKEVVSEPSSVTANPHKGEHNASDMAGI